MSDEKHLPYYEIIDAFQTQECPLCFLIKKRMTQYFNEIIEEGITDKFFRIQFNKDFGFCNKHAHRFLNYANGRGVAIAHETLLAQAREALRKGKPLMPKKNACIACEKEGTRESQYIDTFKKYLLDEGFQERLSNSAPLCVPHYTLLTKKIRIPDYVREHQSRAYAEIHERILRAIDHTHTNASDEDMRAWKQLLPLLYGYEGKE